MFGVALVSNSLLSRISEATGDKAFVRGAFPMLSDWGIQDEDTLIHSLGCSYWMQLGHHLGFSGAVEIPAPLQYAVRAKHDIRSDAVWFDKVSKQPKLVVEYERYSGSKSDQEKLVGKVKNLLLAHRRWLLQPELLVLAYWTSGLKTMPDHQALKELFSQGFLLGNGERVEGSNPKQLVMLNFVFECDKQGVHKLVDVIERG
ncbi:hypothetical protein [Psychromonas arctica]|uniref:hypothetical protein n=1 Tax=Psychromonas arctica TaxID=168275 RepID=UPI00040C1502|nr:hypothetical protein [Psychromonas arctica]